MKKKHFVSLADAIRRTIAKFHDSASTFSAGCTQQSLPVDRAETILIETLAAWCESQGGNGAMWRAGIRNTTS